MPDHIHDVMSAATLMLMNVSAAAILVGALKMALQCRRSHVEPPSAQCMTEQLDALQPRGMNACSKMSSGSAALLT